MLSILNSLQAKVRAVHKRVHSQCENVELELNPAYVGLSTHKTEPQYDECGGMGISNEVAMEEHDYEECEGSVTSTDIVMAENPAYITTEMTSADQDGDELEYL